MKGCLSVYHLLPQRGILLRVFATTTMAVSTMSATTATIGLLLLAITARTTYTSTSVATSVRRTATFAQTATLSVVSKNNS